jgi:hypothetical protein
MAAKISGRVNPSVSGVCGLPSSTIPIATDPTTAALQVRKNGSRQREAAIRLRGSATRPALSTPPDRADGGHDDPVVALRRQREVRDDRDRRAESEHRADDHAAGSQLDLFRIGERAEAESHTTVVGTRCSDTQ